MRKIAAAAGVHELALTALRAQVQRRIPRRFPARLVPYLVDGMLENVERGAGEAITCNAQHIVRLHRAIRHDRAKFDGLVAHTLRRRMVAEQGADHIRNDAYVDRWLVAVCL